MEQKRKKHILNKTDRAKVRAVKKCVRAAGWRLGLGQVRTIRHSGRDRTNCYNISETTLVISIKITYFIPSDPVIPVLGILLTDFHTHVPRNMYRYSTFTAASFVIVVDWKQHNYTPCGDSLNNDTMPQGRILLRQLKGSSQVWPLAIGRLTQNASENSDTWWHPGWLNSISRGGSKNQHLKSPIVGKTVTMPIRIKGTWQQEDSVLVSCSRM